MKSNASHLSVARGAAAFAVAGVFALAAPASAQTAEQQAQQQQAPEQQAQHVASAASSTSAKSMSGHKHGERASHSERVEARIAELRSKLKITPQQETQWNELTQVMRDNARQFDSLAEKRMQERGRMTAVEDLQSYSQMADAHAEGLKRFVPAFQSLYDSMSDAQKKQADALFQGHTRMAWKSNSKSPS